jgi:multidrug resistance efflux pump
MTQETTLTRTKAMCENITQLKNELERAQKLTTKIIINSSRYDHMQNDARELSDKILIAYGLLAEQASLFTSISNEIIEREFSRLKNEVDQMEQTK